ncbi:hypothetical protein M0813_14311 [Anaeramoeba flamelloides]|uniref:Uncharacterized protein n=1 Tax=Anaeramoeba flamelloides TaxID=1746091 RepID=A0ABQ8Z5V0_9EUKA|nr:hypothetical protein M0813_14311 [Anaeramoeba flamelloides]
MSNNLERQILGQCEFEFEQNKFFFLIFSLGKTTFFELYSMTLKKVYCSEPLEKVYQETQIRTILKYFKTSPSTTIIKTPKKNKDEYLIEIGIAEFVMKSREFKEEDEIRFNIGSIQNQIGKLQAKHQKEIGLLCNEYDGIEERYVSEQKKLETTRSQLIKIEKELTDQEQKFLKEEEEKKKMNQQNLPEKNKRIEMQQKKQILALQNKLLKEQKKLNKLKEMYSLIIKDGERGGLITDEMLVMKTDQLRNTQKELHKIKIENKKKKKNLLRRKNKNQQKIVQLRIQQNIALATLEKLEKTLDNPISVEQTHKKY